MKNDLHIPAFSPAAAPGMRRSGGALQTPRADRPGSRTSAAQDIHLPHRGDLSPLDDSLHAGAVLRRRPAVGGNGTIRRIAHTDRRSRDRQDRGAGAPAPFGVRRGDRPLGDELFQLTWQSNTAHVYSLKDGKLRKIRDHRYPGEGWGLTTDGEKLYMSDGTATIYTVDPATFRREKRVTVTRQGTSVNTSTNWNGSGAGSGPTSTPPTGSSSSIPRRASSRGSSTCRDFFPKRRSPRRPTC